MIDDIKEEAIEETMNYEHQSPEALMEKPLEPHERDEYTEGLKTLGPYGTDLLEKHLESGTQNE